MRKCQKLQEPEQSDLGSSPKVEKELGKSWKLKGSHVVEAQCQRQRRVNVRLER